MRSEGDGNLKKQTLDRLLLAIGKFDGYVISRRWVESTFLAIILTLSLSGCELSNLEKTSVTGNFTVAEQIDDSGVSVMTEDAAMYCLVGKVGFGSKTLKAGQCYKDGEVYSFSVKELVIKFPKYNSDRVRKQIEIENSRERHPSAGVE